MLYSKTKTAMESKITKAFRELRKLGYTAKQNFWCCQTCGWAALTDEQANKAVFYHHQDYDVLKKYGYTFLCWSGDGNEIVSILQKHGIKTNWDGSKNKRIGITII